MSTVPERELPDEIEQAIERHALAAASHGWSATESTYTKQLDAQYALRHAILTALEPERAVQKELIHERMRAEQYRLALRQIWTATVGRDDIADFIRPYLVEVNLADDLTATSSAHEGSD